MPPKSDRSLRSSTIDQSQSTSGKNVKPGNYDNMSSSEILNAILARNSDPVIDKMLMVLIEKPSSESIAKVENKVEKLEAEKRGRSVVISGLSGSPPGVCENFRFTVYVLRFTAIFGVSFSVYRLTGFGA